MPGSCRSIRRPLSALTAFGLSALFLAGFGARSSIAVAQGTHLWVQSQMEEFEKGTPDGVAIESDGQLRQGPGLTEQLTTPSTFVWAVVTDKTGQVFAGTGTPADCAAAGRKKGREAVHTL